MNSMNKQRVDSGHAAKESVVNARSRNQISCTCPSGHKIRGDASLSGKKAICPRCKQVFVFGVVENKSVTDTGVMRILGDLPTPAPPSSTSAGPTEEPSMHPCGRCNIAIDSSATVCRHCNAYVGAVPGFMRTMLGA